MAHETGLTLNAIVTKKEEIIKAGLLKDVLTLFYGYVLEQKKQGKYPKTKFYFGRM